MGLGKFTTCLLPMVTDETHMYFRLHTHYLRGVLLKGGGLEDQSNKYLEAMELLESKLIKNEVG